MRIGRRTGGWLLILYAVLGFALVIVGAWIGLEAANRIERLASDADTTLSAASRATVGAADSFSNVNASLSEAEASSDAAAALARDASGTLDALAVAMDISVLGAQPLLPLGAQFRDSADQAEALAGTLDRVSASLGDTRTDVALVGPELLALSEQLDGLGGETDGSTAPPLRLFVTLVLAWLLMPAIASLVAGLVLLNSRAPRAEA